MFLRPVSKTEVGIIKGNKSCLGDEKCPIKKCYFLSAKNGKADFVFGSRGRWSRSIDRDLLPPLLHTTCSESGGASGFSSVFWHVWVIDNLPTKCG